MLIAQISDFHAVAEGRLWRGVMDVNAQLEAAIAFLNSLDPRPDVVLATGDITADGKREEYDVAVQILSGLAMPCYALPGNHDDRDEMRRAFASGGYLPQEGALQFNVEDFPLRIIALDTLCPGETRGEMGETRTKWLALKLVEQLDRPTLIAMHHPPFVTGMPGMDAIRCFDVEGFAGAITANANVEAIICGHTHRAIAVRWHGTLGCIAPSTAMGIALDFREDTPLAWTAEPPACVIHHWREGEGIASHVTPIGTFPATPFRAG